MAQTRRSFLTGLAGLFASLAVPSMAEAATPKKTVPTSNTNETEKLIQMYMPLCEQLEGNMPFAYKDKDHPTIGCGVHFKNFTELDPLPAIKIIPQKGCCLNLDKNRLQQIVAADWKDPQTRIKFPEVAKIESVKLKDCPDECPTSKMKTWDQTLYWIPKATLDKANRCAAAFCVNKAKEIHPNLFRLPPSVRMLVVDMIYGLGENKYKDTFPKFQKAIRTTHLVEAKEECKVKNNERRNSVRQWLVESAILVNQHPALSSFDIQKMQHRPIKKDNKFSPTREKSLWCEIDKATSANCSWKKVQIAQAQKACRSAQQSKRT